MGTSVTLTVYNKEDEEKLDGAFDLIYEIESKISANRDNTYIDQINKNAGIREVVVPKDEYDLIKFSLYISEETDGYFDPVIGALSSLWAIGSDHPHVPGEDEILKTLPLLNPEDVVVNDENRSVFLKKEGMRLDLGGIGKGYTADRVKDYLTEHDVKRAIIDLGGNILLLGQKEDGALWKVGIMDPEDTSSYFTMLELEEGSVVTSGPYERFFVDSGVTYHHILNPETGYPWDTNLLSCTIVAPSSVIADGLSTAVFAGGAEEAERMAENFDVSIILYTNDRDIICFGDNLITD